MYDSLVICQGIVVVFLAVHDWVPLGPLNNLSGVRAVDTRYRRAWATALSALPFTAVFVVSLRFVSVAYPHWLLWWLWGTYLACAYSISSRSWSCWPV